MKKATLLKLFYCQRFRVVVAIEDTYRNRGGLMEGAGVSSDRVEVRDEEPRTTF